MITGAAEVEGGWVEDVLGDDSLEAVDLEEWEREGDDGSDGDSGSSNEWWIRFSRFWGLFAIISS